MLFSGMLRRVALEWTDVSVENVASVIRVTRIGELGTTLAATSNRGTMRSTRSSETSDFTRAIRRNIAEDGIIYNFIYLELRVSFSI
jgi:hypothetical protein